MQEQKHEIDAQEAKARFTRLLRDVRDGREYLITHNGMPVARLLQARAPDSETKPDPRDVVRELLKFRTATPCDDISLEEVRQAKEEGRG